ncbi:MAG TPA: SGNH/GDSL hydrolase family protein [Mucilaginibacter sp.]|nr:SGNH/GDSL hydrolase family protein [Mucilaginibacter sp.]
MKNCIMLTLFSALVCFYCKNCFAQSQLIKNLRDGKKQTLVVYGTSLSVYRGGTAWVNKLSEDLNRQFDGNLKVINAAKSAMWSTWGVQHLEDSVIAKKPDAVLMEFSMNDAFLPYHTSPALAQLNLNYMIDRIKIYDPHCEVILQLMDLPVNENAKQRPHLAAYMQMYREVAKKRGLLLIDHSHYWKKILDKGKDVYLQYVPDGIHPDERSGRELIEPYIIKQLEK